MWTRYVGGSSIKHAEVNAMDCSHHRGDIVFGLKGCMSKPKSTLPSWFLNDRSDVRSSFYCEEVGTEFDVQGLELDWTGVCWDADFRYWNGLWKSLSFSGTRWQQVNTAERRLYLKNAYRVILTRARQGMIVFVPKGAEEDATRLPAYYNQTYEFLKKCGLREWA